MADFDAAIQGSLQGGLQGGGARSSNAGSLAGFMAAAFCAVGMIGLVASYTAPLPYQREIHREAVLDRVLALPEAQRAGLRDDLGDSADAVLTGAAPLEQRVASERAAMRVRFAAEADALARGLRWLILLVTLLGALFGAMMLGLHRKA